MSSFTIGTLARAAGVNLETIRYYQRRGLLPTPPRPPGGVRRYPAAILQQLRFIKRAQELGFSLREIQELLRLGKGSCRDARQLAEKHLTEVETRLQDLQHMRRTLATLIRACRAGADSACPIVETLTRDTPENRLPRRATRARVRRSN
jgi:MerR family mercuric resistance operon transcriptional regulator